MAEWGKVVKNSILRLCQWILLQMGYDYNGFQSARRRRLTIALLILSFQSIISFRAVFYDDFWSTVLNVLGTAQIFVNSLCNYKDLSEEWEQAAQNTANDNNVVPVPSGNWRNPWGVRLLIYSYGLIFCILVAFFQMSFFVVNLLAYFMALLDGLIDIVVNLFDATIKE